jgi:hypothetical protein
VEYRWVPGHKDVAGNELADQLAKKAATLHSPPTTSDIIATASLANISRDITLAKRADRDVWLRKHCKPKTYYRRPQKPNHGPEGYRFAVLSTEAEQGTDRPLPPTDGTKDKCWWCSSSSIQNRDHLFKFCKRWKKEQRVLWKAVKEATKDGGQKRWPTATTTALLADDRCTEAVLDFLGSDMAQRGRMMY